LAPNWFHRRAADCSPDQGPGSQALQAEFVRGRLTRTKSAPQLPKNGTCAPLLEPPGQIEPANLPRRFPNAANKGPNLGNQGVDPSPGPQTAKKDRFLAIGPADTESRNSGPQGPLVVLFPAPISPGERP